MKIKKPGYITLTLEAYVDLAEEEMKEALYTYFENILSQNKMSNMCSETEIVNEEVAVEGIKEWYFPA